MSGRPETPPRAWGRPALVPDPGHDNRNTPTSVGKTTAEAGSHPDKRKHPHERGEDALQLVGHITMAETPPRAWGRRRGASRRGRAIRNTPTSVGKTIHLRLRRIVERKHPHERGEDHECRPAHERGPETPPRAWGRPASAILAATFSRNTPTSVGKTACPTSTRPMPRKHPHERGEDMRRERMGGLSAETPPRAWGRLCSPVAITVTVRNTPTSVGKTAFSTSAPAFIRKHPHERGEDFCTGNRAEYATETPPRAWGRLIVIILHSQRFGNTPTSVGKTPYPCIRQGCHRKHPHERGEDLWHRNTRRKRGETPPRAWGRLLDAKAASAGQRNTPTSVGKTGLGYGISVRKQKHPHERGEDCKTG